MKTTFSVLVQAHNEKYTTNSVEYSLAILCITDIMKSGFHKRINR